jgi:hypothetical protein
MMALSQMCLRESLPNIVAGLQQAKKKKEEREYQTFYLMILDRLIEMEADRLWIIWQYTYGWHTKYNNFSRYP